MHDVNPIHLEHQLRRWMQPDAHRFIRPDWRRFVRPEFQADHPFALYEGKYSPDQPRVPPACPVIAVTSASATFIVGAAGRSKAVIKPPLEEWPTNPKEVPPGWEWKGRPGSQPGDKEGSMVKPKEPGDIKDPTLRYDESPGHRPHWDYRAPDG